MRQSKDSVLKRGINSKTGKEIIREIRHEFRSVPLEKLSFVCYKCGWEQPVLKLKNRIPVYCPKGCGTLVIVTVTGNLSHYRYNTDLENLQIRDKFEVKRIK
uniref:Uncharacterized protein n=1 Tax=viral metagenome TaxID=1070528 RepID=A0A6M3IHW1_9ZZZZ